MLKALLEDGEMLLADGRRFVSSKSVLWASGLDSTTEHVVNASEQSPVFRIHPDFRVIALANRPGYPFLGNDFFAEMGDVFSCHPIDNPDQACRHPSLFVYAQRSYRERCAHMIIGNARCTCTSGIRDQPATIVRGRRARLDGAAADRSLF